MLNDYRLQRFVDLIENYKRAFEGLLDTSRYLQGEDLDLMRKALRDGLKRDFKAEKKNSNYFYKRFIKVYKTKRKEFADRDACERIDELIEYYYSSCCEGIEAAEERAEDVSKAQGRSASSLISIKLKP